MLSLARSPLDKIESWRPDAVRKNPKEIRLNARLTFGPEGCLNRLR
jgi:hypothetical protein